MPTGWPLGRAVTETLREAVCGRRARRGPGRRTDSKHPGPRLGGQRAATQVKGELRPEELFDGVFDPRLGTRTKS